MLNAMIKRKCVSVWVKSERKYVRERERERARMSECVSEIQLNNRLKSLAWASLLCLDSVVFHPSL